MNVYTYSNEYINQIIGLLKCKTDTVLCKKYFCFLMLESNMYCCGLQFRLEGGFEETLCV